MKEFHANHFDVPGTRSIFMKIKLFMRIYPKHDADRPPWHIA